MPSQKEYKKLLKLLKANGFEQVHAKNHPKFVKDNISIVTSRNCKNAIKALGYMIREYQALQAAFRASESLPKALK